MTNSYKKKPATNSDWTKYHVNSNEIYNVILNTIGKKNAIL